jgi:hypothetical protein
MNLSKLQVVLHKEGYAICSLIIFDINRRDCDRSRGLSNYWVYHDPLDVDRDSKMYTSSTRRLSYF